MHPKPTYGAVQVKSKSGGKGAQHSTVQQTELNLHGTAQLSATHSGRAGLKGKGSLGTSTNQNTESYT